MELKDFHKLLGVLEDKHSKFVLAIEEMMELMDEADGDDIFGTEGWKHRIFSDQ